jgi:O-antigen/teichoic acid export membrane protein
MLAFPALTLLWATADSLMPLLYGPMWVDTVPILVSLSFVGFLRVVNNPNSLVTQARGRVMSEAVCQAIFMVMMVAFVFAGTFFGVQGVVLGMGIASLFFLVIMTWLALSIAGVSFLRWLGSLRTSFLSTVAMGLAMLGFKAILPDYTPPVLQLLVVSLFGIVVYAIFLRQLLTSQERQLLERFMPVLPVRLRGIFMQCIGSPSPSFK